MNREWIGGESPKRSQNSFLEALKLCAIGWSVTMLIQIVL